MALFVSIFPILLLIWLMVKKNSVPSYIALPVVALVIYLLQLTYFHNTFVETNAYVMAGVVATLTPITIIFGAILFNYTMESSGSIHVIRSWLSQINPNPIAQLMIIGWAFAFMIEGASGFGTPAAIAAPILVGLGFNPLKVAIFALVMNSVPVSFGAVGTPTWFGFGELNLDEASILMVGQKSALIHAIAGLIVPIVGLSFISSWQQIRQNIVFIYLSILACTVPYVLLAQFNYEFPALVGGAIGLLISIVLANKGVGLSKVAATEEETPSTSVSAIKVAKALMPLGLLMFILVVTRIQQLGIKGLLNDATAMAQWSLNAFGIKFFDVQVSKALIVSVQDILGQGIGASYKTLYVPALIPFVLTVLVSVVFFKLSGKQSHAIFAKALQQTKLPFFALLGALIMVKLMMAGGDNAMVKIIGEQFAMMAKQNWIYFGSFLGAIGTFFSGSATVSNLTFGAIQQQIALEAGLDMTTILATQSVGGSLGNMVCINNIVAVCSILGIDKQEGVILKKTVIPMLIYAVITGLVAVWVL